MGLFRIRTVVSPSGSDGAEYESGDDYQHILIREDDDVRQMIVDLLVQENGYEASEEQDPNLEDLEDEENDEDDDVEGSFLRKLEVTPDGPNHWTTSEIPGIDSYNDGVFSIERIDVDDLQKRINKLILEYRSDPNDIDVLIQFIKGLDMEG